MLDLNTVNHGDCLDLLKEIKDNSVDAIVTDPPYGLSFMGKKWDYDVPSQAIWEECLRVLKPGGYLLAFAGTRTQHRMAVRIEDAGFEIRDMIAWVYGCYSEDTECLTKQGWKVYSDLSENDYILQWDSFTDSFSWSRPENIYIYEAPKEMVRFKNRHTDQLLTENHSVYLKYKTNSRYSYGDYFVVPAANVKKSGLKIFPLASKLLQGFPIKEAYLIGWWMTDAWLHEGGKACMFSQSKPLTLARLKSALDRADCGYSEYKKTPKKDNHNVEHTFYVTGPLAHYLISNFRDRKLTYEVLEWDYESRLNLLEGLLDGDGSRNIKGYVETFWSKNPERLDVVSSVCTSLGFRNHIDYVKGCVYLNRSKNTTEFQQKHLVEKTEYSGNKVWCLTTKTGAFVVRREGRPFISGNSGFPKSMDIGKAIDKMLGTEYPKNTLISNTPSMTGGNYTRHTRLLKQEQAKEWEGWGTALKPALEPITVARKPLELTVAQNVLKYGTGGLNIDECRIPLAEGEDPEKLNSRSGYTIGFREEYVGGSKEGSSLEEQFDSSKGRFPANLIHDGSEEVVRLFPESGGSVFSAGAVKQVRQDRPQYGDLNQNHVGIDNFGDKGSAARFFYCPKAFKSEKGIDTKHPTVKPIKLMEYLIKLVSKENALILDPFGGSGTTALACKNVNRNFILIERESEYVELAKERILQSTPDESGLTFE